jgi:hypothetical protein
VNVGQEAKLWYEQHEPQGELARTILRCLFCPRGYLIKRGAFLLMAETVLTDGRDRVALGDSAGPFNFNCWYVYYAGAPRGTASVCDFMAEAPFPLPYVAFKRRGKLRVYLWERIRKDLYYGRSTPSPNPASA